MHTHTFNRKGLSEEDNLPNIPFKQLSYKTNKNCQNKMILFGYSQKRTVVTQDI